MVTSSKKHVAKCLVYCAFRRCCRCKRGKRLPKGAEFAEEPTAYPYIRIVDFANDSIKTNGLKYLTAEVQQQISRYIIHKEDVYISIAGTIGLAGTIPNELDGANLTENAAKLIIKVRDKLDKEYLANYLNGEVGQTQIENLTTKTTQPKLALARIEQIRIPLPPIEEQHVIAQVLQTAHLAIQTRRNELKLERERKAALMEYLFTHGTHDEPTKKTEIGEIPENWQVVELGEIITLHRGYDLPSKDRKPGIVPIISSSGMSGTHSEAKVTAPGVVTGRYGTIGEVFYIEQDFWPLNTTLYASEFRRVTPHFVAYLLRTLNFNIFNDKSTVPGVNRNDLHRIKTVLPPPSEQQDIVDILSTHENKLSALKHETILLEELFNTLLEELMTGRLSTLPLIAEGETHE